MKRAALAALVLTLGLPAAAMAQQPPPDDGPLPPARPGSDAPLPGGSYKQSCTDFSFWGGILRANCASGSVDMDNKPIIEQGVLNYAYCTVKDQVTNFDGNLICSDPRDILRRR